MGAPVNTIAAISTSRQDSAVGMIRISGESAFEIAEKVFKSKSGKRISEKEGYTALFGSVFDGDGEFDTAVALIFRAPKSYTGEDVVEITVHGGFYVTTRLLRAAITAGARLAEAGEFTKRAYLNRKMTLSQAEAVAEIISAKGSEQAKAALSVSNGRLNKICEEIRGRIIELLGEISAYCDYPDEDIVDVSRETLLQKLETINKTLSQMLDTFDRGRVLKNGVDTAIVGNTNVGKSTIMNLLSGFDKSIVTEVAGTTRDIVEDTVSVGDFVLNLSDTAGIRDTDDKVEAIGVKKAREKIENASLIIAVFDASKPIDGQQHLIEQIKDKNVLAVINKDDLKPAIDEKVIYDNFSSVVRVSALRDNAQQIICSAISDLLQKYKLSADALVIINERQYDCALRAKNAVCEAISQFSLGFTPDMIAINLEEALRALCELSGENATQFVVDEIFSKFCVGK